MSFSNPSPENPVKKFIEFKSQDGQWKYYDKKQEKEVVVPTPFYFVVLDELSTIKGYNSKSQAGLYSNEVKNVSREKLHVRSFKGDFELIGMYQDIKDKIKTNGGRFTKSIYALLLHKDGHELVNFQLKGAAFSKYFNLRFNQRKNIICVMDEIEKETSGTNTYNVPVFKLFNMRPDVVETAVEADQKLQVFFEARKQQQAEQVVAEIEHTEHDEPEPEPMDNENWEEIPGKLEAQDDLPF